jgi:hypothetical protein
MRRRMLRHAFGVYEILRFFGAEMHESHMLIRQTKSDHGSTVTKNNND